MLDFLVREKDEKEVQLIAEEDERGRLKKMSEETEEDVQPEALKVRRNL